MAVRFFHHWAVHLPISLHGLGFRFLDEIGTPEYLVMLEKSISRIMSVTWGGADWGSGFSKGDKVENITELRGRDEKSL